MLWVLPHLVSLVVAICEVLSIVLYIFLDALGEWIFLHKVGVNDEIDVLIWEGIKLHMIHSLEETIIQGIIYVIQIK